MPTGPLLLRGRPLVPGGGPFVFGILNCTPDSFSDGGLYSTSAEAIEAGLRMADAGADAIDVGGESTRPGSLPVSPEEQIRRTEEVIAGLAARFGPDGPAISIDTRSARVARAALDAGGTWINDVSALRDDPEMAELAARRQAGVILMHMRGRPLDMQRDPTYSDVVGEIRAFLAERASVALAAGISRQRIVIDPGIGFGKTATHNFEILGRVGEFRDLQLPIMIGASRKRFVREALESNDPADLAMGTAAIAALCTAAGVECHRVHDVRECRLAARIANAVADGKGDR